MFLKHHPQTTQVKQKKKKKMKKGFEFCKIIHSNIIQDQCLILPLKFIQKFGNDVSNAAILKVSDGKRWHVELRKTDSQIMFHNGWQEFVDYYSISTGHFLVFRYIGNSTFRVVIFDTTCSEIGYPNNVDNLKEQNCGEAIEDKRLCNSHCDANGINSSKKQEEFAVIPSVKGHSPTKTPVTRKSAVVSKQKDGARSFRVVIKASYLGYLRIPTHFTKRYLTDSLRNLTLEVSEGHRWLVGCILYRGHGIRLSKGWKMFVKENSLKVGDVCVFEMIKHALWKVHISRKGTSSPTFFEEEDEHHSTAKQRKGVVVPIPERHLCAKASVTSKEKTGTTEASRVLKLKHPSFRAVIKSSYLHYLRIPVRFSARHLDNLRSLTLEISEGHRWSVSGFVYNSTIKGKYISTNVHLSKGWQKFVRENNLREGDVCVFEIIKGTLWKVHISRKSKNVLPTLIKEEEDGHHSPAEQGKGGVVPILERHCCGKASLTSKEKTRAVEAST